MSSINIVNVTQSTRTSVWFDVKLESCRTGHRQSSSPHSPLQDQRTKSSKILTMVDSFQPASRKEHSLGSRSRYWTFFSVKRRTCSARIEFPVIWNLGDEGMKAVLGRQFRTVQIFHTPQQIALLNNSTV